MFKFKFCPSPFIYWNWFIGSPLDIGSVAPLTDDDKATGPTDAFPLMVPVLKVPLAAPCARI